MDCKAKLVKVIIVEDGQASYFNGYTGGIVANDKLKLTVKVDKLTRMVTADISVHHPTREPPFTQYGYASIGQSERWKAYNDGSFQAVEDGKHYRSIMTISPNRVSGSVVSNPFGDGNWVITRYYKNDWSGIVNKYSPDGTRLQVIAIDCRGRKGSMDTLIKEVDTLVKSHQSTRIPTWEELMAIHEKEEKQ